MPSSSRKRGGRSPSSAADRQRAASARMKAGARRSAPRRRPGEPAPGDVLVRQRKGGPQRIRATGIALRMISCGLVSLAAGLTWKLTLAPQRLAPASAALGILFLLSGFVVGGLLWYLRDARMRLRDPRRVDDERIVFSFIVFAVVPFMVLAVVAVVYVVALLVGAS